MTSVVRIGGTRDERHDGLGWVEGEVRDGLRVERVRAHLLRSVGAADPEERHVDGQFDPVPALAVGKAARLVLDDGRSALLVVVSERGRFRTVGLLA
jgi:hypothetical protein